MIQQAQKPIRYSTYKLLITFVGAMFLIAPFLRWSVPTIIDPPPPISLIDISKDLLTSTHGDTLFIVLNTISLLLRIVPFGLYLLSVALAWAGVGIHHKLRRFSLVFLTLYIVGGGIFILYEGWYQHLEGAWLSRIALLAAWYVERLYRRKGAVVREQSV